MSRAHRRGRPDGWRPLLAALAVLVVLVSARRAGADSVTLEWTAPGDDGNVGTAASYEMRVSTLGAITDANWAGATLVTGLPTPAVAGTRQSVVVDNLTNGTPYWFAIKAVDDAGNWSGMSNVLLWNWVLDTTAPAAPIGLSAVKQGDGTVRVSWTPNAEADLSGYAVYRAFDASGPFGRINSGLVSGIQYVDGTVPGGTEKAWYQLSAQDVSGNESAHSATAVVNLVGLTVAGAGVWTMQTGYPNPSMPGAVVRLPVVVPGAGGSAVMEIMNSSGQRVRRQALGTLSPGATLLQWDGKNDAGREVAPGAYTAWLIAGNSRVSVRLVRMP